ncbi:unnamed protein product [Anisakis simplex]|uniref:Low-density lipoprotein receptor domain class A n=1 Tax=Anisakis simplex TaxID=6269 RepID=A0A0M3KAL9_ANISI|nr:unnamed protein product [Anisakis simplex]
MRLQTISEYFLQATRYHVSETSNSVSAPEQRSEQHNNEHAYQYQAAISEISGADEARRNNYQEYNQKEEQAVQAVSPDMECNGSEFRCPYLTHTVCVHYDKLCDGVDDCGDGSDELKCESQSREEGACGSNEYRCDSGQCIPNEFKCNHRYDCQDGSDETVCGE